MKKGFQYVASAALGVAVCSSGLYGQHYTVGMSADLMVSGSPLSTNQSSTLLGTNYFEGSYGTYPTVSLSGHGERYSLASSYSYGVSRSLQTEGAVTRSHNVSLSYSTPLGPTWHLSLSDGLEQTTNSSTFRLFRGDTSTSEDFNYIFDAQLNDTRRTNTITAGLNRRLTERGSLTFGASHSLLIYDNVVQYNGTLSNQQRISVNAGYSQSVNKGSWNLGYFGTLAAFQSFATARTHAMHVGFSRQLSQSVSMNVSGGPSYVEGVDIVSGQVSGDFAIGITRAVRHGGFSASYSHNASDTSGYGSIADNQSATLTATRNFGRYVSLSLDFSAYDSRGKTATVYTTRGYSAGGNLSYKVADYWSLNFGGQYQHTAGNTYQDFDQKRIFASVKYHSPELWRF